MDMFARLSHHSTRWFNLRVDHGLSKCEGKDVPIDLGPISSLVPVDLPWSHVVALCEKSVLPAYRCLKGVLEEDIDHVSNLLSELDPLVDDSEDHSRTACPGSPSTEPVFAPQGFHSSDPIIPERRKRKRRRSSTTLQEPVVIRPTDSFAPTIVVTPCPPQPQETSCWVPYQDASFGARLMVPTYAPLNSVHPPMVAPMNTVIIQIDRWEYARGHWHAVIPPPDEQCRRGLFSRTALSRRRARCPPSRTTDSSL